MLCYVCSVGLDASCRASAPAEGLQRAPPDQGPAHGRVRHLLHCRLRDHWPHCGLDLVSPARHVRTCLHSACRSSFACASSPRAGVKSPSAVLGKAGCLTVAAGWAAASSGIAAQIAEPALQVLPGQAPCCHEEAGGRAGRCRPAEDPAEPQPQAVHVRRHRQAALPGLVHQGKRHWCSCSSTSLWPWERLL